MKTRIELPLIAKAAAAALVLLAFCAWGWDREFWGHTLHDYWASTKWLARGLWDGPWSERWYILTHLPLLWGQS